MILYGAIAVIIINSINGGHSSGVGGADCYQLPVSIAVYDLNSASTDGELEDGEKPRESESEWKGEAEDRKGGRKVSSRQRGR